MTKVRKICGVLLAIFIPIYVFAFIEAHLLYCPETIVEILTQQIVIFSLVFLLSIPAYGIVSDIRFYCRRCWSPHCESEYERRG